MATALEGRLQLQSWAEREWNSYRGRMLRGWSNLMASRFGRPVWLVGGALEHAAPRDIDVRVVVSASEFESRFGSWKDWGYSLISLDRQDEQRRWHLEMAKLNRQGAGATQLPVDFQVDPLPEAMKYESKRRRRLDDVNGIVPPWED